MEERRTPRLVTQRLLEIDAGPRPAEPPGPGSAAPAPEASLEEGPSAVPLPARSPSEPIPPSNRELLLRQERWLRERAKFPPASDRTRA